ncbi:MAG: hypothetical protein H6559_28875 [Lewinellaceae bacterium]|nr:hypothetical protein [Lewinellaceae bacterium]
MEMPDGVLFKRRNLPGLSVVSALLTRQRLSKTFLPAALRQPGCCVSDKRCRVQQHKNLRKTRQVLPAIYYLPRTFIEHQS